jgi:hypothetical protein
MTAPGASTLHDHRGTICRDRQCGRPRRRHRQNAPRACSGRAPTAVPGTGFGVHCRPEGAKPGGAWVPWVEPADAGRAEAGSYPEDRQPANIMKAVSLVPDEVRSFSTW